MSAFTEFRDKLEGKITGAGATTSVDGSNTNPVMGNIFEAIYQYGRGATQSATQKLTSAFRASSTGKSIEAEATRQKLQELMPYIILGVLAIILGSYFVFKR